MKETATGRIHLTEDAEVIEGLLQSLYGVNISLFQLGEELQLGDDIMKNIDKLIQLYAAGEKVRVHTILTSFPTLT